MHERWWQAWIAPGPSPNSDSWETDISPKAFGPANGRSAVLGRNALVCRATAIKPDASINDLNHTDCQEWGQSLIQPAATPRPFGGNCRHSSEAWRRRLR